MKLTVEVPYGDVDAMGHLNNVAYLRYLEYARQKYWLAMRGSRDYWDIDFVMARAEIDYKAPSHMGDVLEIDVRVARVGNSSFDFSYVVTGADGVVVAEATTVQVMYDWDGRRSKPMPEERRKQIEEFEKKTGA